MFLMDIAQSDDADRLLRELDMLKDDALEAADATIRATDPALADLCDALRWTAADGNIQAITAVTRAWTPRGLLLTAAVTVATGPSDVKVIEHVPRSLVQGGPLLEYVSKDPEALTAALVTRWSPGHAPISASRLRSSVFRGLYTAREQPPAIDTVTPPEIQSQKVSHKIHKPISQFLLLECSVSPVRSGELLHQIEQAGEHSWATAPTFALLQAGIPDTASPPPLTPPSHAPYLTKGQTAPSAAGTLFASAAFTPASALYRSQDKPTPTGAEHLPASLLPEQTRLSFSLPEPASQVQPAATDPTPPESPAPAAG